MLLDWEWHEECRLVSSESRATQTRRGLRRCRTGLPFFRSARRHSDRMQAASKFVTERVINETMAFHRRFSVKVRTYDRHLEVSLSARGNVMSRTLVADLQHRKLEPSSKGILDTSLDFHAPFLGTNPPNVKWVSGPRLQTARQAGERSAAARISACAPTLARRQSVPNCTTRVCPGRPLNSKHGSPSCRGR
jgi:hypothetical protein